MRIIARIALKNLIRQRARFLLVLLVGVLGIVILTLIGGYYEFIYYGLRESLIRSHYAHLVIRNRDFTSSELINPFVKMIENPDSLIQKIEKQPNVILASERIRSWGIISTRSGRTSNIKIRGIVPEKEMLINTFVRSRKGKELNAESNYEIEVGAALAKKLELKVDDEVVISAITSNNIHNAMNMRVKAIVGSFSVEFDEILVKMPISIAQELFEVDMVQEIVVLLKSTSYAPRFRRMVQREILEKKDDLEAVLWSEQAGFFRQVVMFFNGYYNSN